MFQCVLLGVPHRNVLQGVQPAAHRRNVQIVLMASTKKTRLAQVNGDMARIACFHEYIELAPLPQKAIK